MPPTFASAPKCSQCSQSVYHAEQVLAVGKIYHKGCLRCSNCQKSLDSLNLLDHNNEPYCKSCYRNEFGNKGYGAGMVGIYPTSSTISPTRPNHGPPLSPKRSEVSTPLPEIPRTPSPIKRTEFTNSPNAITRSGGVTSGLVKLGSAPSSASKYSNVTGTRDGCKNCGKVVYFAESVLAAGHKWHRACLRCAHCSTTLVPHSIIEHDNLPYCKKCHVESFGNQAMTRPGLF